MSSCKYPRLKEVDDVLGGAAAWENVDTTDGELVLSWYCRLTDYSFILLIPIIGLVPWMSISIMQNGYAFQV